MKHLPPWLILLGTLACAEQMSETLLAPDASTRDASVVDAAQLDAQSQTRGMDAGSMDMASMDASRMDMARDQLVDQMLARRDVEIIEPLDAAPPQPCETAIDLNLAMAERGFYAGDTRGFLSGTLGSCGGAAGGELLFKYTASNTDPVMFATDYPQTRAPTVLYVRADCQDEADLACVRGTEAGPGTQLIYTPPAPGVVYLHVDTGSRDGGGEFRLTAGPPTGPACGDGRDNDGDDRIDLADPGCVDATGESEADPAIPPLCADGLDNDEDGAIDYPDDMDCPSAGADAERLACMPDMPCDGKNMGPGFSDGTSVGSLWQAYRWRAPQDADITRLEIFTGEREGPSALHLYTSVDDSPAMRLGGAEFVMQNAVGWQGVDLEVPAIVAAETDYWLVWQTIDGAQSPFEEAGERVDYKGSFDEGASWSRAFQNGVKYRIFCCDR